MHKPSDIQENGGHTETALSEGADACWQGQSKRDCPYPRQTPSAQRWLKGFDAEQQRQARLNQHWGNQ